MSREAIFENFSESHHCENLKRKFFEVPTKNGDIRTSLGRLQGSLNLSCKLHLRYNSHESCGVYIDVYNHSTHIFCFLCHVVFYCFVCPMLPVSLDLDCSLLIAPLVFS